MSALYPETLQEMIHRFATNDACLKYLEDIRWSGGFECPSCKYTSAWSVRRGYFRCTNCRSDTSVTCGTVFAYSHLPLTLWFLAIWSVVSQKQGTSALGLSRILGINRQKTGWQLLRKIRSGMIRPGRDRLSGVVEVDEILLGGKRHIFEGRSSKGKTLVLVAVEDKGSRGIGRIRMHIIPKATAFSLQVAITSMVEPGSTVRTDGWTGYLLQQWGYRHIRTPRRPSIPGDDPTPLVHRVSSLLKRWLLGTHQGGIKRTHLQEYLDEFVFRFNRRTSRSRGKLFYRLIQNLVNAKDKVV